MVLPGIDTAVLVGYLAAVVGFGCWFVRKTKSADDFMVAGRSLPGWAVGLSILGTYVSSISFLAYPGKAFSGDWNAFVFSLSLPLTILVAVRWFVPFFRHSGEVSAYHHLEQRFGAWARTYAVVCYLLTQVARMGTILYLLALALHPMTGWPVATIVILTGVLVTLYTLVGGSEAVIWTDAVHSVVMVIGVAACVVVQMNGMPHGPGQVLDIASAQHKFDLGGFGPDLTRSTFWVVLLYGIFINLQNFGIDQSYVQRYISARSDPAAKRSLWMGGLTYIPLSAMFFFIGTALFAFYFARPELLPPEMAAKEPDKVFPYFITHQLPVGLRGLVIAAIFAAAMNGFGLNTVATIALCDLYRRYLRPRAEGREAMAVLYGATLACGALATAAALLVRGKNVLDVWWEWASVFSGGTLGLFLLGRLSRRADGTAAAVGTASGVVVILWMTISPKWKSIPEVYRSPFHAGLVIVLGTLTILVVGLATTALRQTLGISRRPPLSLETPPAP